MMPHPLQSQMLDRMSRSHGVAVGPRALAHRAVLSLLLGLAMVSAAGPSFAQSPAAPTPQEQVSQASHVARWWGEDGIGFSLPRFKTDMMARGFTPEQALSAYQWMDHLSAPTFGSPAGDGMTAQGLHDRDAYSASLKQSLEQGPEQFDAWQTSTIADFHQMLDGLEREDTARIMAIQEYSDALGIMPQVMQQLASRNCWENEEWDWSGLDHAFASDRAAGQFHTSIASGGSIAQARSTLDQAVHDAGLRWFRAPVALMQSSGDIQSLAGMLDQVNRQIQQQTGLIGPALGLNGRVSWDMSTPPGDDEGITNEHASGIVIRGRQSIIFHEFEHALGAAMNKDVGLATVDGDVKALFASLEAMQLPYSPGIEAERWEATLHMAREMGLNSEQMRWIRNDSAGLTRELIQSTLLGQGVSPLNASLLSANASVLNEQTASRHTSSFIAYRNAVIELASQDDVGLPTDYLLNQEETIAYQAQYRIPGSTPIDTWQSPTTSEKKLQDGLWAIYYAKAQAWQKADLLASSSVPSPSSLADRIHARRSVAAPPSHRRVSSLRSG